MQTYQAIARCIGARNRCAASNNPEWEARHQARIDELVSGFPSGSGFDSGTELDDASTPERLIFNTSFHHMNDGGFYDGWTSHQVIATPSLEFDYSLRITGRNRNEIKDVIADEFRSALEADNDEFAPKQASVAQA